MTLYYSGNTVSQSLSFVHTVQKNINDTLVYLIQAGLRSQKLIISSSDDVWKYNKHRHRSVNMR